MHMGCDQVLKKKNKKKKEQQGKDLGEPNLHIAMVTPGIPDYLRNLKCLLGM